MFISQPSRGLWLSLGLLFLLFSFSKFLVVSLYFLALFVFITCFRYLKFSRINSSPWNLCLFHKWPAFSALIQSSYSGFHRAVNLGLSVITLLGWALCSVHLPCVLFTPLYCTRIASTSFPTDVYRSNNVFILLSCFVLLSPFSDSLAGHGILSWHFSFRTLEAFHHCVFRFCSANKKCDIVIFLFFWRWFLDDLKESLLLKWS